MKMQNWLVNEMIKPLVRRAGTALGAFLVGQGVAAEQSNMIVLGATTALAVGIDLFQSNRNRKNK